MGLRNLRISLQSSTNVFRDRRSAGHRKYVHVGSLTDILSVRVPKNIAESLPLRSAIRKRYFRNLGNLSPRFFLFFNMQTNMQITQLGELYSAGCIGHHTGGGLGLGEGDDITDGA